VKELLAVLLRSLDEIRQNFKSRITARLIGKPFDGYRGINDPNHT
jgi:hypothetical protein